MQARSLLQLDDIAVATLTLGAADAADTRAGVTSVETEAAQDRTEPPANGGQAQ